MKLKTKNRIICAAGIILSLSFCSCNPTQKSSSRKTEISFSWWGKQNRTVYTLNGISQFQKLYPDISVKPDYSYWDGYEEKFEQLYKTGRTADVMLINFDWLYRYSADGNGFYDLNQLSDIIELPNFTLNDLEFGVMNGKLNALPTAFNAIIPVYNKTVFEKYGLSVPETWDDFFKAAGKMRGDGYYVSGVTQKPLFFMLVAWFEQTHGKQVFLENSTYNLSEEETGEMLTFLKRLFDEKVIYPDTIGFNRSMLYQQKIASAVGWCSESSQDAEIFEKQGCEAVLGNFISSPDTEVTGWYLKPATMYAIKKDCRNPKQAATLVNYLLNNEEMALLQKCEKGIPASNKSLTTLMENGELAQMEYLSLMKIRFNKGKINRMLPVMENKYVLDIIFRNSTEYVEGKTSLKTASSEICRELNDFLQK